MVRICISLNMAIAFGFSLYIGGGLGLAVGVACIVANFVGYVEACAKARSRLKELQGGGA